MHKREITYTDYNGEEVTDTFYFNLTKSELVELEVNYEAGLESTIKKIIETKDNKALIEQFKRIILLAYGVKSDDGKRFIKNDATREEFSQTAAYDSLFMELATNDSSAATFVTSILPRDMTPVSDKPVLPPPGPIATPSELE